MSALPADWRLGGEWPGGQPTRAAEENQGPGQGPCGMRRKTGERGRGRPAGPGPGGPSCPGVPGICSELRAKEPAVTPCSFRTPFRLLWSPPLGSPGDAPERTTGPHRADPQHPSPSHPYVGQPAGRPGALRPILALRPATFCRLQGSQAPALPSTPSPASRPGSEASTSQAPPDGRLAVPRRSSALAGPGPRVDPCPAGPSTPSLGQGPGLCLACTAVTSLLSRLTHRAHRKQGGTAESRPLAGRAAWPLGQECPQRPFTGAAGSPAFHLAGARGAEASRGSGCALSVPRPQEALKGAQATSLGLAATASAHCCGLGPTGPDLPAFCLSPTPPPVPLQSTAAAGVPPQSSTALRRQFLPLAKPCWACPTRPGGALLPSGFKCAPFCRSGPGSKCPPPRERRLLTAFRSRGSSTVLSKSDTTAEKACLSPCSTGSGPRAEDWLILFAVFPSAW